MEVLTIQELIHQFLNASDEAEKANFRDKIITEYLNYTLKITRSFLKTIQFRYSEPEDYLHVFVIAMDRALQTYIPTKGSFIGYFKSIYLFELYREIGREIRKNAILFNSVSLNYTYDNGDGLALIEVIEDKEESNPRATYERDQLKAILRDSKPIKENNPNYEKANLQRKVLVFKYFGYKNDEIATILGITRFKVRYLLDTLFRSDSAPLSHIKKMYK